jgi:PPOX class probable F420-dependent enzyme
MSALDGVVALQRFSAARVAVLGTVNEGGSPLLVPVTFVVSDDVVAFAVDYKPKTTTFLRRLRNIERNPRVGFLVDTYDDDWAGLWWVRVDAIAETVTGGRRLDAAIDALALKYPQYQRIRPRGPVVLARVQKVVGWAASPA